MLKEFLHALPYMLVRLFANLHISAHLFAHMAYVPARLGKYLLVGLKLKVVVIVTKWILVAWDVIKVILKLCAYHTVKQLFWEMHACVSSWKFVVGSLRVMRSCYTIIIIYWSGEGKILQPLENVWYLVHLVVVGEL